MATQKASFSTISQKHSLDVVYRSQPKEIWGRVPLKFENAFFAWMA